MSENNFDARFRFSVRNILEDIVGYKGLPFPGAWWHDELPGGIDTAPLKNAQANKGATLYKKDLQGNYYFLPVSFMHNGREYEIDCALISITGSKNIVETPLVGRKGSVKELISISDYQISITGALIGYDKVWPEDKLDAINELFTIDEAVELKCALTDIFFEDGDKVVITDLELPEAAQSEHVQVVQLRCITDKPFELTID